MAINIFVLPKAMVGLTLLDVVAILNLPLHDELLSLYGTSCVPSTTLAIKFSKDDSGCIVHILNNLEDGHTEYNTNFGPIWFLIHWARL
ncbi:hypothetical protein JHK84_050195 [Glycine max]|nr:hypothetical protein JHK84_050195 [Glycine max]